jgi:hypothetical protein
VESEHAKKKVQKKLSCVSAWQISNTKGQDFALKHLPQAHHKMPERSSSVWGRTDYEPISC